MAIPSLRWLLHATALLGPLLGLSGARATAASACRGDERWHVIVTASHQYLNVLSNWLVIFDEARAGMAQPPTVEIIAEDDDAYAVLSSPAYTAWLPPDTVVTLGREEEGAFAGDTSGKVTFNSGAFKALMARRGRYMRKALEEHCRVVFSDSDVFWLGDPFDAFEGDCDLWAQVHVRQRKGGSFDDPANSLNPGFSAVVRNERTLKVIDNWSGLMAGGPTHNMPKFNTALGMTDGIKACPLREQFPEGNMMEWEPTWIEEHKPLVIHNNWVGRKEAKLMRFHRAGLWPCDVSSCDDPAVAARRHLYAAATGGGDVMSAQSLWDALLENPQRAETAGLGSKPLEGAAPVPCAAGDAADRFLDKVLRRVGLEGSTVASLGAFLEIFYE